MGFLGPYADLTDYALGNFRVDGLSGRDPAGAPKWRVACGKCGDCQIVPHRKLAVLLESKAPENLCCANGGCELSRSRTEQPVTLADLRQQERREAEQVAQAALEERRKADAEAAKQARRTALKAEYRRYFVHQLKTKIALEQIVPFDTWTGLSKGTRQMVMKHLRADPQAYFPKLSELRRT